MRKRLLIRLLCVAIIFLLAFPSACASTGNTDDDLWYEPRDCAYFEAIPLEIRPNDQFVNSSFALTCSCATDKQIAMILTYRDNVSYQPTGAELVILDKEGKVLNRTLISTISADFLPEVARYDSEGRLNILGTMPDNSQRILVIGDDGSKLSETILMPITNVFYIDILPYHSGWALLSYDRISFSDRQGEIYSDIPLEGEPKDGCFTSEDGENPSVLLWNENKGFSVSSANAKSSAVSDTPIENLPFPERFDPFLFTINGPYTINDFGVYAFNSQGNISQIADWNRIDVPLSRYSLAAEITTVLNDDLMIRAYQPANEYGNDEINLLVHRDQDPNAGKPTITIGGYGVASTLMQRAVYYYNTGNFESRVALVDYREKYPFSDASSMVRAKAAILADMSSGKGADIYAGIEFDYDQWGDAGQVMDLSPMFNEGGILYAEDVLPALTETNRHNGKIYKVFPSFSMWGCIGYSTLIGEDIHLTIDRIGELRETASQDQMILSGWSSTDLAINAVQFRMQDFITENGFSISDSEFQRILDFASTYGQSTPGGMQSADTNLMYATEDLLLDRVNLSSPKEFWENDQRGTSPMIFYGMPSLNESARIIQPQSVVAISSGTKYPEACMNFISILLSDEMQIFAGENFGIPVMRDAFEEQIQNAMQPVEVSGENAPVRLPMSAESAARYRESVDSLNYIYIVNIDTWSLLRDEFESYFSEGKSATSVRESMINRMNVYFSENSKQ